MIGLLAGFTKLYKQKKAPSNNPDDSGRLTLHPSADGQVRQ